MSMSRMGKNSGMLIEQHNDSERYVQGGVLESLNGQDTNSPTRCLFLIRLIGWLDPIMASVKRNSEFVTSTSKSWVFCPVVVSPTMLNREICVSTSKIWTVF